MKLVADEGVDLHVVERLRADGHDVTYVAELSPGIDDAWILEHARREDALLVTSDKDFGELVYRQGLATTGVLLLRLAGLAGERKAAVVAAVLDHHGRELVQAFSVVTDRNVRVRRVPSSSGPDA